MDYTVILEITETSTLEISRFYINDLKRLTKVLMLLNSSKTYELSNIKSVDKLVDVSVLTELLNDEIKPNDLEYGD